MNGDDDYLPGAAVRPDLEKVLFAVENPDADVRALDIVSGAEGTRFTIADKAHGSLPAYIPACTMCATRFRLMRWPRAWALHRPLRPRRWRIIKRRATASMWWSTAA